jgi:hypothetical protein
MSLRLRHNVHWCESGGRAIFLDIEADRYFCLPKSANDAFLRLANARMQSGDDERLGAIIARGLLVECSASNMIRRPPALETPTCDYAAAPQVGLPDLCRALAAEMRAARSLRTRPLRQAIAAASGLAPEWRSDPRASDRTVQAIVAASHAISFLTRTHNRCLVRALAVHSTCKKRGISPKLVFGVIAHPFAAHCWVQLGSAVLVDGFEHARLYSPILVIE